MNTLTTQELLTSSNSISDQRKHKTGALNGFINAFKHSRLTQVLTALLGLQLVVSAVLGLQSSTQTQFATGEPLLSASIEQINEIEIADVDNSIQLKKDADEWYIAGENKLPAQASKVTDALNSITTLKTGLPVANSEDAQEQLRVSDDDFVRRISISGDEIEATTMLLGTSPGLRKSHLRREDTNEIYSASLPVSVLPTDVNNWLDKSLLAFKDITAIELEGMGFSLTSEGDAKVWKASKPPDDSRKIDYEKFESLVAALQELRVNGVAESEQNAKQDETAVTVEILVVSEEPETTITLKKHGDIITVKRGDVPGEFILPATQFDQISERASLESVLLVNDEVEPISEIAEPVKESMDN